MGKTDLLLVVGSFIHGNSREEATLARGLEPTCA
jgi:hypothetical protein